MTMNNNNNNNNNNNINSKNQQGVVDGDANSNLAAVSSIDIGGGSHWTMAAVNVSEVSHVTDEDVLGDVVAASDSKKPSREPALRIDSDVIHRTYSDSGLTAPASAPAVCRGAAVASQPIAASATSVNTTALALR